MGGLLQGQGKQDLKGDGKGLYGAAQAYQREQSAAPGKISKVIVVVSSITCADVV